MDPIGGFDSAEPNLVYCRPRFGLKCYQRAIMGRLRLHGVEFTVTDRLF